MPENAPPDPPTPPLTNIPPPLQDTEMPDADGVDKEPLYPNPPPPPNQEWWRDEKDAARKRLLNRATKQYGLRMLEPTDRIPPELLPRINEFGHLVLIRPGPPICCEKKSDPLRSCFEYTLGVDPNMGTFLVCACPWN